MAISKIENNSLASGVPSTAKLPAGTVLQVVNASTNTIVGSTVNTFADTGLTATITPSSATSKILILVSQNGLQKPSLDTSVDVRLLRDSTTIMYICRYGAGNGALQSNVNASAVGLYLDSPATTSPVTYKTQFSNDTPYDTVYVQFGAGGVNSTSSITLMEIAA